jgi:hypothetical protein
LSLFAFFVTLSLIMTLTQTLLLRSDTLLNFIFENAVQIRICLAISHWILNETVLPCLSKKNTCWRSLGEILVNYFHFFFEMYNFSLQICREKQLKLTYAVQDQKFGRRNDSSDAIKTKTQLFANWRIGIIGPFHEG